jgi:hypothetical protein
MALFEWNWRIKAEVLTADCADERRWEELN